MSEELPTPPKPEEIIKVGAIALGYSSLNYDFLLELGIFYKNKTNKLKNENQKTNRYYISLNKFKRTMNYYLDIEDPEKYLEMGDEGFIQTVSYNAIDKLLKQGGVIEYIPTEGEPDRLGA